MARSRKPKMIGYILSLGLFVGGVIFSDEAKEQWEKITTKK